MSSAHNNFSDALVTWKEINLLELQKTLDTQGLEIIENQKESVIGRKALAERTKDFKKIPDDEKLNAWKGLLKAYQTEIDSLTKRSKTSENAFLNLYKRIAEAPDPYPLLETAVDQTIKASQTTQLEEEIASLRRENQELTQKVQDISTIEANAKKWESKTQALEERMENVIKERVDQRESELNAAYDEKLRNYEDRTQELTHQLNIAKSQLLDLRTSNESTQAQLIDHTHRQDQETLAKLAELDIVAADLERANARVATVERRNELLRAEIESTRNEYHTDAQILSLQERVAEHSVDSERLSQALEREKRENHSSTTALRTKLDDLGKALSTRDSEILTLKAKLKQFDDYDEIKRELDIMKFVEFAGLDEDDEDDSLAPNELGLTLPSPNPEKARRQNSSLEALLAAKNKRIMEELTRFRILHDELEASLRQISEELADTKEELDKQKVLNDRLESDLLQMEQHKPNGTRAQSPDDSFADQDPLTSLDLGNKKEPTNSGPIPFAPSADTSILPIVTSQRDRFRQRNAELEQEIRKQFQTISDLRTEVKTLQTDNLKLYEKVRYMQSYREEAASSSTLDPLPAARQDDLSKYHARYEEAINPFEAFRGREAAKAYQALNPVEKLLLTATRTILGTRRARNLFILYALCLHLLVMFTIFEYTASSGTTNR